MGHARFYRWYRVSLLTGNGIWRVVFCVLGGADKDWLDNIGMLLLWPTLPYVVLAWSAVLVKTRWVLFVTTFVCLTIDVLNGMSMLHPVSSTAAVGALFVPIWQLLFIVPGGIAFDWILRWAYRGFRIRRQADHSLDDEIDDDSGDADGRD
jgi:hypothetical protein